MQTFEVENHAPSLLPDGADYKLTWNDEFDGNALDTSKWGFRLNYWGRRVPHFSTEGVVVRDGCVELHVTRRADGGFAAPFLQTGSLTYDIPKADNGGAGGTNWPFGPIEKPRFMQCYGYYECRCKLQRLPGWWSAFWLQAPGIGATGDIAHDGVECDIMESFEPGRITCHAMHAGGYGKEYVTTHSHKGILPGIPTFDIDLNEWHYFGVDWSPEGYVFYVDGVQHGRKVSDFVSHTKQFVLLSCECKGYRPGQPADFKSLEKAVAIGDCFIVDHVRVFKRSQY